MNAFYVSDLWLAVLIFIAGVLYIACDSLRVLFVSRGQKTAAFVAGSATATVFLLAVAKVLQNLGNPINIVAYATGYGLGNIVGILIEGRIASGTLMVRVITRTDASKLVKELGEADFGVTQVAAKGTAGKVRLIFSVIQRANLQRYMEIVDRNHPNAFVSVDDVRSAHAGVFPRSHRFRFFGRT